MKTMPSGLQYVNCPGCGYELCWMDRNHYDECPMCGRTYTVSIPTFEPTPENIATLAIATNAALAAHEQYEHGQVNPDPIPHGCVLDVAARTIVELNHYARVGMRPHDHAVSGCEYPCNVLAGTLEPIPTPAPLAPVGGLEQYQAEDR